MRALTLFAGTGNRPLAEWAAELGTTLAECAVERFPDGEVSVTLGGSVRRGRPSGAAASSRGSAARNARHGV